MSKMEAVGEQVIEWRKLFEGLKGHDDCALHAECVRHACMNQAVIVDGFKLELRGESGISQLTIPPGSLCRFGMTTAPRAIPSMGWTRTWRRCTVILPDGVTCEIVYRGSSMVGGVELSASVSVWLHDDSYETTKTSLLTSAAA